MVTASPLARQLVRTRAEQQMLASINVLRGQLGVLDPVTGNVGGLSTAAVIYQGKARIRPLGPGGSIQQGDGTFIQRDTTISIPAGVTPLPLVDDLVQVVDGGVVEGELNTRILRITFVEEAGGLIGDATRLSCVGWLASRYWGEQ